MGALDWCLRALNWCLGALDRGLRALNRGLGALDRSLGPRDGLEAVERLRDGGAGKHRRQHVG